MLQALGDRDRLPDQKAASIPVSASDLFVHRSTVRYRLQRIRELTNADLTDPDTRFNLQWRRARAPSTPRPS